MLPSRRRHEHVADSDRVVAILALEPDDEVELLILLDHLRRDVAPDRGLDEAVDVVDVDPVPGDLAAIDLDFEAGLSKLLDKGHIPDPANVLEYALDGPALLFERREVRPKNLDREGAFETGLGLV